MRLNHESLRLIRELKGYTQTKAADLSSIPRPNYAHMEAGRRPGTPAQIMSIASALGIPVGAITHAESKKKDAA